MFVFRLLSEEGPNTELAFLLWWVLGFFFLMVIIGWLVSRNKKPEAEPVQMERKHSEQKHADNLEIIEGIGPKVAKVLAGAGITSFNDLAGASASNVEDALKAAGLNMMSAAGWIEQAKLAARGDMEGLKKMQSEMKGGRLK